MVSDPSRTKHDKETNMARNQKKITDTFNIEFNTGDFTGIKVPHKVYNELQVEAHKSKFDGVRVKDRRDISTHVRLLHFYFLNFIAKSLIVFQINMLQTIIIISEPDLFFKLSLKCSISLL